MVRDRDGFASLGLASDQKTFLRIFEIERAVAIDLKVVVWYLVTKNKNAYDTSARERESNAISMQKKCKSQDRK